MQIQAFGYVFLLFLDSFRGPAADGPRTGTGPRTTTLSSTGLEDLAKAFKTRPRKAESVSPVGK